MKWTRIDKILLAAGTSRRVSCAAQVLTLYSISSQGRQEFHLIVNVIPGPFPSSVAPKTLWQCKVLVHPPLDTIPAILWVTSTTGELLRLKSNLRV